MDDQRSNEDRKEGGLSPDALGYCYFGRWHFDVRMEDSAKRLMTKHGNTFERFGWLIMAALFFVTSGLGLWLFPSVPVSMVTCLAVVVLAIWLSGRAKRFAIRIANERLCLRCTYPLLKSPIDEAGWGQCPECGRRFHNGEYVRPPVGYKRIQASLSDD